MAEQAPGITYDTVAREWRCKWSPDDNRKAATKAQQSWLKFKDRVKSIPGVIRVDRLCCGTGLDFKIIVSMNADSYWSWAEQDHAPESEFLAELRGIEGISNVEAQLYSLMEQ
mmetsp:Transcript_1551/g.1758  ORF Transcript_1551/g.1758 Transcript_1551/m.1758 type:complete len:113 (-) Transcript_1551:202-540(-)